MAGARIQVQGTGERCMDRALINTWGRVNGQIEGDWVGVTKNNSHVQQVCMQVINKYKLILIPIQLHRSQFLCEG